MREIISDNQRLYWKSKEIFYLGLSESNFFMSLILMVDFKVLLIGKINCKN